MKLLGHFVSADLRRFGGLIAVWLTVAMAGMALRALLPVFDASPDRLRTVGTTLTLLTFADVLLVAALVAAVVQEHSLVGTDAFWMTRPIGWDVLLASKIALLGGLLVGVPVAGEVVHMAAYGVPAAAVAAGALQMALFRSLGLVAVMAVAAITPSISRFAVACGAALLAAAAVATLSDLLVRNSIARTGIRMYEAGTALASIARERVFTQFAVAAVGALAAGLGVLAVEYRWRALWRSVGAFVACVALFLGALLLRGAWPVPAAHVRAPGWTANPGAARLVAGADFIRFTPLRYGRENSGWALGWVPAGVAGVPPGWVATARLVGASLDYPGGRLESPGHVVDRVLPFADRNTDEASLAATVRDVLGVRRFGSQESGVGSQGTVLAFVADTTRLPEPGSLRAAYRGEYVLTLTRIAVAGVLSLQPGATFTDGPFRFRIERIETGDRLRIYGRRSDVRTVFDRSPRPDYSFVLRNRARTDATQANVYANRVALAPSFPRSSAFTASVVELYLPQVASWMGGDELTSNDDWLKDTELVVIRTIPDGMVVRILEISSVQLSRS